MLARLEEVKAQDDGGRREARDPPPETPKRESREIGTERANPAEENNASFSLDFTDGISHAEETADAGTESASRYGEFQEVERLKRFFSTFSLLQEKKHDFGNPVDVLRGVDHPPAGQNQIRRHCLFSCPVPPGRRPAHGRGRIMARITR